MKSLFASTAIVVGLLVQPAVADPTFSLGLSFALGGAQDKQVGISGRILSNNHRDEWGAAIGGTYYPNSNAFGLDAGVGYNAHNLTSTLTYDFMNEGILFGLGWADLEDEAAPIIIAPPRPS